MATFTDISKSIAQQQPLSSKWGKLSPPLIATFFEVDKTGKKIKDGLEVKAIPIDGNLDLQMTWISPFEQSGDVMSMVQQVLQSGALEKQAEKVDAKVGTALAAIGKAGEGRTSVTKLNSTQVFTGLSPMKVSQGYLIKIKTF